MNLEAKYKNKIKIPMEKFVPKSLFDLCILTEKALFDKGYKHTKNNEFIVKDNPGAKGWLYFMDDHLIWSTNDIASYHDIRTNTDIERFIKGRTLADIRAEKLKLIYGYDDYGYE